MSTSTSGGGGGGRRICLRLNSISHLFIEAQHGGEGGDSGIDIVLRVELQKFGLRQIHFGKGQDPEPDFSLFFVSSLI